MLNASFEARGIKLSVPTSEYYFVNKGQRAWLNYPWLRNVPCATWPVARHACPSAGPCSRARRAVLCLSARQRHQPCLGFERDRGFLAGTRAIVQCGDRAFGRGRRNAMLDPLVMQSKPTPDRKKPRILSIRQQDPRPLNPTCRFGSRLSTSTSPNLRLRATIDRPLPRCHGVQPLVPQPLTV